MGGGFISNKFYSPITVDGLTFGALQTANTNPLDTVNTGDPFSSFILNVPVGADRRNVVTETRPGGVMSEFVQDSWRATSKLTINVGLRYDLTFNPPMGTDKQIGVNGGPETGDVDFNNGTYIIQKLPPPCSVRGFAPCIPGYGTLPPNVVMSPNDKILHDTYTNIGRTSVLPIRRRIVWWFMELSASFMTIGRVYCKPHRISADYGLTSVNRKPLT